MNDDRDTRGEELSTNDGRTRPGQVDGRQFGGVPGDGASDGPDGGGFGGQSRAPWPGGSGGAFGDGGTYGNGGPYGGPTADGPRTVTGDGAAGSFGSGPPGPGPGAPPGQAPPRGNAIGEPRQGGRRRSKRRPNMSWWVELPILLVFALVLALLIKRFVVQAFFIPSPSMENSLEIGDQ